MQKTYVVMPFGKHKGELIENIDSAYLAWALRECTRLDDYVRRAIEDELDSRVHRQDDEQAEEHPGVLAWRESWKKIIFLAHPDRGGDPELCKLLIGVNDAMKG